MQYNNHLHKYKKTGFGGTSQHLGSRGRKSLIGDIVNSRPPGGLHKESLLQKVKRKEGRKERGKEERKEGKERKEKKDSNYIRNVCRLYANTIPFYEQVGASMGCGIHKREQAKTNILQIRRRASRKCQL